MVLPRLWFSFFTLTSVLIAVVSLRFLFAPLDVVMVNMAHYATSLPLPLYGHIVLAPLALFLTPFQLWAGLRTRFPRLHRWSGRTYGVAVLGAGLSSLVMLGQFQGSASAAVGFGLLAVLWIGFTVMGVAQAQAGNFAAHRQWMLRSVALTFGAVMLRIYMAPMMASGWTVLQTYDVTAWASWLPNLIVIEMWMRRKDFVRLSTV